MNKEPTKDGRKPAKANPDNAARQCGDAQRATTPPKDPTQEPPAGLKLYTADEKLKARLDFEEAKNKLKKINLLANTRDSDAISATFAILEDPEYRAAQNDFNASKITYAKTHPELYLAYIKDKESPVLAYVHGEFGSYSGRHENHKDKPWRFKTLIWHLDLCCHFSNLRQDWFHSQDKIEWYFPKATIDKMIVLWKQALKGKHRIKGGVRALKKLFREEWAVTKKPRTRLPGIRLPRNAIKVVTQPFRQE